MAAIVQPRTFKGIASVDDLAHLLGSTSKQLRFLLYVRPEGERYTEFSLPKRRGGVRSIKAPRSDLKSVQRRLSDLLQDWTQFRPSVHGFIRQRSIATNASRHVQHRAVLNIDLKDFFPTINFGRVRGLFMASPLDASPEIATVLAQICSFDGSLPQGAPTSPVVSNLICSRMDAQLQQLAKSHGCIYTRYADDMTFSKRKGAFPDELAKKSEFDDTIVGVQLREIVEKNGFNIHPEKIHLYRNTHRQTVTGLTVNRKVNVSREFVRSIRAMICDWRRMGLAAAEAKHHEYFYRRIGKRGRKPPLTRIISGKLNFLSMVRGPDDPVKRNLQRQLVYVWPEYEDVMRKENSALQMRDLFISHATEDKVDFVRPLVQALIKQGITVWFDEYEMTIGSDLVRSINDGLSSSRYGVVILSPNFFKTKKVWPEREVGALLSLEDADGKSRVLPIWHKVDKEDVAGRNPLLLRLLAWKSSEHSHEQLALMFRDFLIARRVTKQPT